jgi:hypothetical protein
MGSAVSKSALRVAYKPSADLKSGIPEFLDIPAPENRGQKNMVGSIVHLTLSFSSVSTISITA